MIEHQKITTSRLESLDGLRGLAVLLVLFSHLGHLGMYFHPVIDFKGAGKAGVFLFFSLSAFLLATQFYSKPFEEVFTKEKLLRYFVRRFLRIFPLFSIVVVVSGVFTYLDVKGIFTPLNWNEVGAHLLLMKGKSVFWTIPVEFKYYFLLPVVIVLSVLPFKRFEILGGVVLAAALLLVVYFNSSTEAAINNISLVPYLPVFFSATIAAFFYSKMVTNGCSVSESVQWFLEVTAILCLLVVFSTVPKWWNMLTDETVPFNHFHRSFLLYGVLWAALIFTHLFGKGVVRKIFSFKPLRMIGKISFSIYLWHFPVIYFVKRITTDITMEVQHIIVLALIMMVSSLSFILIEYPFSKIWTNTTRN